MHFLYKMCHTVGQGSMVVDVTTWKVSTLKLLVVSLIHFHRHGVSLSTLVMGNWVSNDDNRYFMFDSQKTTTVKCMQ